MATTLDAATTWNDLQPADMIHLDYGDGRTAVLRYSREMARYTSGNISVRLANYRKDIYLDVCPTQPVAKFWPAVDVTITRSR